MTDSASRRFLGAGYLRGPGFALGSVVLHAGSLAFGAWLLARSLGHEAKPSGAVPAAALIVSVEPDFALPEMAATGPTSQESTALAPPLEAHAGGRLRPRPDLHRAGRGGERSSQHQATNLVSSIDPIALEREPATARERSQVQRLRSAFERASRDDRRATPTPMSLTFLATGSGQIRARRAASATDPSRGMLEGETASTLGSRLGGHGATVIGAAADAAVGGSVPGSEGRRQGQGVADGRSVPAFQAAARVLFARPLVTAARPAVPTQTRGRPNDTLDSSQEVAARLSSLLHASTAGGEAGPGVGGEPSDATPGARGLLGAGSRSSPSGSGYGRDFSDEPGFAGYSRAMTAKLAKLLEKAFPDWAVEQGRGGHVIFEMTLRADGSPIQVRIVRPSGIADYDQNVLSLVRGATGFGRLPVGLGAPAAFRVSWDAMNPVVGRDGSGPGGGHRPRDVGGNK